MTEKRLAGPYRDLAEPFSAGAGPYRYGIPKIG